MFENERIKKELENLVKIQAVKLVDNETFMPYVNVVVSIGMERIQNLNALGMTRDEVDAYVVEKFKEFLKNAR